ncbi:hypothetical protein SLEP1_g12606 [Rubroshorea leprosula]|uniref:Uncharacterized protein n=1 Tax=Rubroshorea leprosula TaxID=152421 RepID=A0AAV5IN87_9ROSI|nr:hypothetical protein SLEP1_g12606 [Rubroshorea leprosula]
MHLGLHPSCPRMLPELLNLRPLCPGHQRHSAEIPHDCLYRGSARLTHLLL